MGDPEAARWRRLSQLDDHPHEEDADTLSRMHDAVKTP